MSFQGAIFDFNGTLFWDTEYHNKAWDIYLSKYNRYLSDLEKDLHFHGKPNKDIFEFLENRPLETAELEAKVEEKESIYREICLNAGLHLAPGAVDLLNFLKISGVPVTIATSSGIRNVDFFFQNLNLSTWFDPDKVVFDDGSFKGKPEPDIFLIAAHKLDLPIKSCVIFEDSVTGINAAINAKAGLVYYVKPTSVPVPDINVIVITDFNQVDRKIFF